MSHGFVLTNDFLETQYKEISTTYEESKETNSSIMAENTTMNIQLNNYMMN